MNILALDLGTHTGVAHGVAGERPVLTQWDLPSGGGCVVGEFMDAFDSHLSAALHDHGRFDLIVFEAPFVGQKMLANMHMARRLVGLPALVELHAHRANIECAECNIMTVKAQFAGHGRADKAAMMAAAKRRGFTGADTEHKADAVGCWWWSVLCRLPDEASNYEPIFAGAHS